MSVVELKADQVKEAYPFIYELFWTNKHDGKMKPIEEKKPDYEDTPRETGESLHDYFMRKKIKCWCKECRINKQQSIV